MRVTPIKNGGQAIIQDIDDCYYYIHKYMGGDFLEAFKECEKPMSVQEELDATKQELKSYEASLESTQRALMDIKEIIQLICIRMKEPQPKDVWDGMQEIVDIIKQEV